MIDLSFGNDSEVSAVTGSQNYHGIWARESPHELQPTDARDGGREGCPRGLGRAAGTRKEPFSRTEHGVSDSP